MSDSNQLDLRRFRLEIKKAEEILRNLRIVIEDLLPDAERLMKRYKTIKADGSRRTRMDRYWESKPMKDEVNRLKTLKREKDKEAIAATLLEKVRKELEDNE